MSKFYIKIVFTAFLFCLSLGFINTAEADTTKLTGWAYSSNIGWISFNSSDTGTSGNYAVQVSTSTPNDPSASMSGYAWSSVGWIKFGGLKDFPDRSSEVVGNAKINFTTGAVTGWARACTGTLDGVCNNMASRTDGWDGWIKLSDPDNAINFFPSPDTNGTNGTSPNGTSAKGITLGIDITKTEAYGRLTGFSWGSNVLGWLGFSPMVGVGVCVGRCPPPPTTPYVTFDAKDSDDLGGGWKAANSINNPVTVYSGERSKVRWTSDGLSNFSAKDGNWSNSGGKTTNNPDGEFTNIFNTATPPNLPNMMTLSYFEGSLFKNISVYIKVIDRTTPPLPQNTICVKPARSDNCPFSSDTFVPSTEKSTILHSNSSLCKSTELDRKYCEYACQTGYKKIGNSCTRSRIGEF